MANEDLVRTTFVGTKELTAKARAIGGGNLSKGCNLLMEMGLAAMAAPAVQAMELPLEDLAEVLANRLRTERKKSAAAVIATSSGAGFTTQPSAELFAKARKEVRIAVMATPAGVSVYGQDTVGNESVMTVDLANGEIAIANADGEEVKRPLDLPITAALAGMFSRAISAAQEQAAQGRSPRKAEPVTHRALGLTVWAAHPDDGHARIQLGGLEQRMHGLVLLQTLSELHSLVARATAEQLEIRQGLEKLMAPPDTKAPALAWEQNHGG